MGGVTKMIQKSILLPLDGSKTSLSALLPARSIAKLLGVPVHVLHVTDEKLTNQELIEKLQLQEEDLCGIILNHRSGDATEQIIEESKNSCHIVICSHGETHDLTKVAGRVSGLILQRSPVPVLLVRPDNIFTVEDSLWKPKKALVPLDGTPEASQALACALEILAKIDTELNLLHIPMCKTELPKEEGCFTAPYYTDYPQYDWPSWSNEFIRRFGRVSNGRNHIKLNVSLSEGDPAEEILSFAQKNKNDLIAMAWHGVLGSTRAKILQEVIRKTPCPVLLTRISSSIVE